MSKFFKKVIFWAILIVLFLGIVVFINGEIDKQKSEKSKITKQKTPNPPDNPE